MRAVQNGTSANELAHSPRSAVSEDMRSPVQLPAICYPTAPPLALVDPQLHQKAPILHGVEYRTATFTRLQVAQTTFCYPPTPPVEMSESSDRLLQYHQQQPGETHALSHIGYGGEMENLDVASSEKTPPFSSGLPTPPHLIPISSDADGSTPSSICNMSPHSTGTSGNSSIKEPSFFGKWPAEHAGFAAPLPSAAASMQEYNPEACWNPANNCNLTAAHLNGAIALKQPSAANAMFFPVPHPGEGEPCMFLYTPSLFTYPLRMLNGCLRSFSVLNFTSRHIHDPVRCESTSSLPVGCALRWKPLRLSGSVVGCYGFAPPPAIVNH